MFIFNLIAGAEVLLVAIPAVAVGFAASFLGVDAELVAALVGLALLVPLDLGWRFVMGAGDPEEGEEPAGCLRVIWPSGGGHLMFIPMWVIGLVGLPMTALGMIAA